MWILEGSLDKRNLNLVQLNLCKCGGHQVLIVKISGLILFLLYYTCFTGQDTEILFGCLFTLSNTIHYLFLILAISFRME